MKLEEIIYGRLLENWPSADGVTQLSLMEIADEIADDVREWCSRQESNPRDLL